MEDLIGLMWRTLRPVVFAVIMLLSLRALGFSWAVSFTAMLIPLVLLSLDVLAGRAMALTALVFVLAAGQGLIREIWNEPGVQRSVAKIETLAGSAAGGKTAMSKAGAPAATHEVP